MRRPGGLLAVTLALGVVTLALLLPVGAMILTSLKVYEVELTNGQVHRAVGGVDFGDGKVIFAIQPPDQEERIPVRLPASKVAEVRSRLSLHHYGVVLSDERTRGLVWHSLLIALGGTVAALLIGLPLAWLLFRTNLSGRRVAMALSLGPAVLPPFFVAMGGARPLMDALSAVLGLAGGNLQMASAFLVFGFTLFPLVLFLVGRALAAVPAGAWEAAQLLGGRGAALRHVVLPAALPAIFGSAALVFVLAWSDFAVPDLLGFMLPAGSSPVHVFPTEILLQWKQHAAARAVATGAPFVLVTAVLLVVAILFLRRSPVIAGGEGRVGRPLIALGTGGQALGWLGVVLILALSLGIPLVGVGSWAGDGGETVARPAGGATVDAPAPSRGGRLFDFEGALDRTPESREDLARWIKTGIGAALLAMAVAVVLARWALVGGALARIVVLLLAAMPLAVPGLVFTVGTNVLWTHIDLGGLERGVIRSVLVLTARFLPFAVLAAWLALREVRRGHEEAAALLGAGPVERALRVWGALSWRGILGGGLAVLVLALREIDAVIEIDARIFPLRIYDKIHFSRLADEANLAILYLGILLVPAIAATVLLGWIWRRRG